MLKIQDFNYSISKIECILSNIGTQFKSIKWHTGLKKMGGTWIHSSVYNPQINPVERYNKEVNRIRRLCCYDAHIKWTKYQKLH